jgi:hypothetical protein
VLPGTFESRQLLIEAGLAPPFLSNLSSKPKSRMKERAKMTGSNGTDKKFVDSAAKANERRTFPRYALSAEAEVVEAQSRTRMNARVSDLSRMGCYVEMKWRVERRLTV